MEDGVTHTVGTSKQCCYPATQPQPQHTIQQFVNEGKVVTQRVLQQQFNGKGVRSHACVPLYSSPLLSSQYLVKVLTEIALENLNQRH